LHNGDIRLAHGDRILCENTTVVSLVGTWGVTMQGLMHLAWHAETASDRALEAKTPIDQSLLIPNLTHWLICFIGKGVKR